MIVIVVSSRYMSCNSGAGEIIGFVMYRPALIGEVEILHDYARDDGRLRRPVLQAPQSVPTILLGYT